MKMRDEGRIGFAVGKSSLGAVLVAASENGICAILIGDDAGALRRDLIERFPGARPADVGLADAVSRVAALIEAPGAGLDLPLDPHGTAIEQRIWRALREIPAGATASYGEIARRLGPPATAQEVAAACAANMIAVAVPCHRVVKADGSISGYRWGVRRKRKLLSREHAA